MTALYSDVKVWVYCNLVASYYYHLIIFRDILVKTNYYDQVNIYKLPDISCITIQYQGNKVPLRRSVN